MHPASLCPLITLIFGFMRSALLFFCTLLLSSATRAQNGTQQIMGAENKAYQNMQVSPRSGATNNYNITYARLELNANPNFDYVSGRVTTYFIPDGTMADIQFDLTDSLAVDSIIYHQASVSFTHSGNIIDADFGTQLPAGVTDSITIYYQGKPDSTGFGSFVQSTHNGEPIIWTLSEPYGARDWWPCKQDLDDKIDSLDVIVTTPDSFRVASNGLLVEELQSGGNKIYHWKHRYPIATYLVCFAVTNYAVYTDYVPFNGDTLPVLNYVYPEDSMIARLATPMTISFMQLYDSLFGIYPFSKEKYGQTEFGWGGGMEHQTMTFVTNFGFEVLAHELAHHWFGDKVTCASWQDIWVNEGFAVYLTGICYEHIAPQYWLPYRAEKLTSVISEPGGSVYCTDTSSAATIFGNRLTYYKSALVLHMLRWVLGDSLFFGGLRSYLDDIHNAYAFANTADLEDHMETTSGMDLSKFFNDWIYGQGFPSYQFAWSQDFGRHVNLTISQSTSYPSSVSFYQVPLPVLFRNSYMDTLMIFNPSSSPQSYSFDLPFVADSLIFDPDEWLISGNNTISRNATCELCVLVYPNPVTDQLQMRVESSTQRKAQISIYDAKGQQQWSGTADLVPGSTLLNIDAGRLSSGMYRVQLSASGQSVTSTFVKGNK